MSPSTRGRLLAALAAAALATGGVGCAIVAHGRGQARVETTQVILKDAERALVRERLQLGVYPTRLDPVPVDGWGRPIVIEVMGSGRYPYRLLSYGADGEPGGRGRNADIDNWEF